MAQTIAGLIIGDPELSRAWIDKWRRLPRESLGSPGDCLFEREDISDRLGEIACPAIVFHGTADLSIEMALAEALCQGLSGCADVVRIEGAPHASNLTHPDQVNEPLLTFLRSL